MSTAKLCGLISSLFSTEELRQILNQHYTKEILDGLPDRSNSKAEIVDALVQSLLRRGLIDATLRKILLAARPQRRAEIDQSLRPWLQPGAEAPRHDPSRQSTAKLFCYCDHADQESMVQFGIHLSALTRSQGVHISSVLDAVPGADRHAWLRSQLAEADVIVFLLGPALFNLSADHAWAITLALARYYRGEASVLPVLLQAIERQLSPFFALESLPKGKCPVRDYPDPDRAWVDVVQGIQFALSSLNQN